MCYPVSIPREKGDSSPTIYFFSILSVELILLHHSICIDNKFYCYHDEYRNSCSVNYFWGSSEKKTQNKTKSWINKKNRCLSRVLLVVWGRAGGAFRSASNACDAYVCHTIRFSSDAGSNFTSSHPKELLTSFDLTDVKTCHVFKSWYDQLLTWMSKSILPILPLRVEKKTDSMGR